MPPGTPVSGSVRRDIDAPGLAAFAAALVVREVFTRHSLEEIEVQFAHGLVTRHSVVYPVFQLLYSPLVRDPQAVTMHVNGVLGSLAVLALYVFVRRRVGSRTAAFVCAMFFATQPVVVRFMPTDGPYALLLAAWFAGLALLSAPAVDARGLVLGAALLAVAATCRIEGLFFLVASVLLLDVPRLIAAARREPSAAVLAVVVMAALGAAHAYAMLSQHSAGPTPLSVLVPPLDWFREDALWPVAYDPPLFTAFMLAGAIAGLFRRSRLGLLAYAAMLVVVTPVVHSASTTISLHRLVPACALQSIAAGIGAWTLGTLIPVRSRWTAVLPGAAAALWILVQNHAELTRPYVFTEEYEMARSHVANASADDCGLLTFNRVPGADVDIHDFRQILPELNVIDCLSDDCTSALGAGGCFYYFRSAACYFHPDGVPPACAAGRRPAGCLSEPSATFERSVTLEPIEVRTIALWDTFPDRRASYPDRAEVGLFRVRRRT